MIVMTFIADDPPRGSGVTAELSGEQSNCRLYHDVHETRQRYEDMCSRLIL